MSAGNYDRIQSQALKDGIFVPIKKKKECFHIYSTTEARRCLYHKTIYISGDSYMLQMYFGMADILLGDPSNFEIHSQSVRQQVYRNISQRLKYIKDIKVEFIIMDCLHYDLKCFKDHLLKIRSQWFIN
jgi:hypothetical protein